MGQYTAIEGSGGAGQSFAGYDGNGSYCEESAHRPVQNPELEFLNEYLGKLKAAGTIDRFEIWLNNLVGYHFRVIARTEHIGELEKFEFVLKLRWPGVRVTQWVGNFNLVELVGQQKSK